ncbi:MAG: hypothetical protein ACW98A_04585 [Candidatus Hodarchaeales archaeon]
MFEYSNTNVMLGYDPGLITSDAVKVIIALDYEYPKRSYSVLAKQICDILKNLRDRFSSSEAKNLITNEFLTNQIENLILQCATLVHLRCFRSGQSRENVNINLFIHGSIC